MTDEPVMIRRLGHSCIRSFGTTRVKLQILSLTIDLQVVIVPDDSIKYDVVLGLEFLTDEHITVDLFRENYQRHSPIILGSILI